MTVRSSTWSHLGSWRWPRVRLWLDFSRTHVIVLAVSVYVGVLLLLYLHLAGQIVAVRSETETLEQRLHALTEENAWRAAMVAGNLSVSSLALLADTQGATAAVLPVAVGEQAHVLSADVTLPVDSATETARPGTLALWLDAFHLK